MDASASTSAAAAAAHVDEGGEEQQQHERASAYIEEEIGDKEDEDKISSSSSRTSGFLHHAATSHLSTPRSRQSSSPLSRSPSPFSSSTASRSPGGEGRSLRSLWLWPSIWSGQALPGDLVEERQHTRLRPKQWQTKTMKRKRRRMGIVVGIAAIASLFLLMNVCLFSNLQDTSLVRRRQGVATSSNGTASFTSSKMPPPVLGGWRSFGKSRGTPTFMYVRLLALAAHALAEGDNKSEPPELWKEPKDESASWTPCADQHNSKTSGTSNGYILVNANGGINQQRIAICNAVAVTRLLNATLVIPNFQYNSVWRDKSQFGDIYQEEHFISYLKADIQIVRELPVELQSLDLEAIGSLVTDSEVVKEAKPSFFVKKILPILLKNRVVHFVGFGNRLAFDPIPFQLQRLRCRCNFHALQFVSKIQEAGALLVKRMRKHALHSGPLEHNLMGQFVAVLDTNGRNEHHSKVSRYLALHLRFEIDMAAYSLCYFGGGKEEEEELEAYRAIHFPALTELKKTIKMPSAAVLRAEGQCPLTPEEAILMLAALGFKRKTHIYIAGAHVYGGKSRMAVLRSLYPNIVTKEILLSPSEIKQFTNSSSKLAALDFVACAAADAFAMTDSGSQFSALVSGYRMYYGGGRLPTIRPNKRRLASIFVKNSTIEWSQFQRRMRKAIRQTKKVFERPIARSIYRHPRCRECMCKVE